MSAALSTQFQTQLEVEKKDTENEARSIAKGLVEKGMSAEDAEHFDKIWRERRMATNTSEKVPSILILVTHEEAEQLLKKPKDDSDELIK